MRNIVKLSAAAAILGLGMVLSAALLSKFFVSIKHEKEISVKGYAEKEVTADVGTFYFSCTTRKPVLADAYRLLQTQQQTVVEHLKKSGFKPNEMDLGNVRASKIYKKDAKGNTTHQVELHEVSQGITLTSPDVKRVREVAKAITGLIKDGIDIRAGSPEFFISDLDGVKLALLAAATENGYRRAQTLAANSGGQVGALRSAHQGVFQITAPNSTETSGYGLYDTSTIRKIVKAVVALEYAIRD